MRRERLDRYGCTSWAAALAMTTALAWTASATGAPRPERPNIVLIMADDLGYECLGANGGTSYRTPVLDRLAKTGMRFTHCYAQPLCTPSRVQIMTGLYNVRNYTRFGKLERDQTPFAHLLKKAGYATCVAGKWQLGKEPDSPQHFGFDESCLWQHTRGRTDDQKRDTRYERPRLEINGRPVDYPVGKYGPAVVTDFICTFMERHKDEPFLVYYPMILTHCPFCPTPDSPDWDPTSKGSKQYKGKAKYFGDMVTYMDKTIGRIVAKLDDLGLSKNTLVLFTADNGTDKPVVSMMAGRRVAGGKGKTTDAGTRVPLIAYWFGVVPTGRRCDDLIDFSDFLPTLCDAAGVSIPKSLNPDGWSFLPQLRGKPGHPREWIYCWYARSGKQSEAKQFARTRRYKLYRSGAFYDIREDVLEKEPLRDSDLNAEERRTKAKLRAALDRYQDARFSALKDHQ